MSTRWYPLYQGCPQLRIFLPNFWMKLIKPKTSAPKNVVTFNCSMEMTKIDVHNYLTKIYNLPVVTVRTRIKEGEYQVVQNKRIKLDDSKLAYVVLDKSVEFEFPDIGAYWEAEQKAKDDRMSELSPELKALKLSEKTKPETQNWFTSNKFP